MASGTYVTTVLSPAFSFTLTSAWLQGGEYPDLLGFISADISPSLPGASPGLSFSRLKQVVDAQHSNLKTGTLLPPPADFIAFLQSNPYLELGQPSSVQIGGVSGMQVDGDVPSAPTPFGAPATKYGPGCQNHPCVVIGVPQEPFTFFGLIKGERFRVIQLTVHGQQVIITVDSGAQDFDRLLQESTAVLSTVHFRSS